MKTVCFDFDGVIHSYASGWKGEGIISDPPVPGIEQVLFELSSKYEIVIQSTRCISLKGRSAITEWLEKYNLSQFITRLYCEKPPAVIYIDDRGYRFDGNTNGLADKISKLIENEG